MLQLRERPALLLDDLLELLGDLGVDTTEVELLALLAAAFAELLQQVTQARDVTTLPVPEALLHQAPQRGVDVPVIEQVVVDLRQDRVGIEVKALLGTIPARVPEPPHARFTTGTGMSRGTQQRPC